MRKIVSTYNFKKRTVFNNYPRKLFIPSVKGKLGDTEVIGYSRGFYLKKALLFSIFIIFLIQVYGQAQQPKSKRPQPKVELIARSIDDSVVLRWAPNSPGLWQMGNSYGYIVERLTIGVGDDFKLENPHRIFLTDKPVKPQTLEQIEPVAMKDMNAGIVAQAIYGETFEVTGDSDSDVMAFFNRAKDIQNRFSFSLYAADQSIGAAKAHGLIFTDKFVNPNERYLYRVYLAAPANIYTADTGFIYINPEEKFEVPKPIEIEARFGDYLVELSWNRKYFEKIFTTYIVERSADNGSTYKKITDLPFINPTNTPGYLPERLYIMDSLPQNDKEYVFRVRGLTPFGEISPPSDTVKGFGKSTVPYINPIIVKHDIINEEYIKIYWEVVEENAQHIKSFNIFKANRSEGPYLLTGSAPSSARTYFDSVPFGTNYYRVEAYDKYKRGHPSFPSLAQLPDSIPPAPPVNLKGYIDSTGVVTIEWDTNNEVDLMGYNVLVSNNPNSEFFIINQEILEDAIYYDTTTLNTLTKKIYYRVSALDYRYNESEYSEILELTRPDMVAPASPRFTKWHASDSGITLIWQKSFSDDVVKHLIYKNSGKQEWSLVALIDTSGTKNSFTDKDVSAGEEYNYIILAVDESGLESEPSPMLRVKAVAGEGDLKISKLVAKANPEDKTIHLAWEYAHKNVNRFVIYRAPQGEELRMYRSVGGGIMEFVDKNLSKGKLYTYRLQAFFENGVQSPISEKLTIKF